MTDQSLPDNLDPIQLPDWLLDFVVQRATEGLDSTQQSRVQDFLDGLSQPERQQVNTEIERIELSVAAIDLSLASSDAIAPHGAPPPHLKGQLLEQAERHFAGRASSIDNSVVVNEHDMLASRRPSLSRREVLSWLAAAASITALLSGANPFAESPEPVVVEKIVEVQTPAPRVLSTAEQLEQFIAKAPADLRQQPWTATDAEDNTTGEVIWSDSAQKGFMVFDGLQVNDSTKSQYQLWIFDTDASQKHPVDGGVFDISASGRVVVSIDANIPVDKAVMFAITQERPGGVVVSDRTRLPLLAKLD